MCEATDSDEPPTFYITATRKVCEQRGLEFKPNFREKIAVTKPYKGNRDALHKPFHYDNLTQHILNIYDTEIANGIEADDLISIHHRLNPDNTVICTRDKDIRITPGYHYGWSVGNSPSFGPRIIEELGYLEQPYRNKLPGGGLKFFYAQMLIGDRVDNIDGLSKWGVKKAYEALKDCESEEELFNVVRDIYQDVLGDEWRDYYKEMMNLLWMVQELDEEGNPVFHVMYDER